MWHQTQGIVKSDPDVSCRGGRYDGVLADIEFVFDFIQLFLLTYNQQLHFASDLLVLSFSMF